MNKRSYLDHAATTPMVAASIDAMVAELTRVGNASSLHGSGRSARRVVEESREAIAACLGARPAEVIFTSGGTEADNLAIKGAFWAARSHDPSRSRILTTVVEHHAVLDSVGWLESAEQATVELMAVDLTGRVDLGEATRLVGSGSDVALISTMWANNEVGTIQPIRELAELARRDGIVSHSDAVQAVGHLDVDFADSGLDALSFTAHKLGGPYGVGALLARRDLKLTSVQHGGGQERDVRSGTLNVAAIAGFAAAVEMATQTRQAEEHRLRALRSALVSGVLTSVPDSRLNGPSDPEQCLPGVANIAFPDCEADSILMLLDFAGIDCSTGSACSAGVSPPSHVLMAMGRTEREARSSLRFSLGHTSTGDDIDALLAALPEAVERARAAGTLNG